MVRVEIRRPEEFNTKIQCIKSLREITGWGLNEAKKAIESDAINMPDLVSAARLLEALEAFGVQATIPAFMVAKPRKVPKPGRSMRLAMYRAGLAPAFAVPNVARTEDWYRMTARNVERAARAMLAAEKMS